MYSNKFTRFESAVFQSLLEKPAALGGVAYFVELEGSKYSCIIFTSHNEKLFLKWKVIFKIGTAITSVDALSDFSVCSVI